MSATPVGQPARIELVGVGASKSSAGAPPFLCALLAVVALASHAQARIETLSWNHPSPPAAEGFLIYRGSSPGAYGPPLDIGLPTPAGGVYTYNLEVGDSDTVYVAMTAYASGLESLRSNELVRAPDAPDAPGGGANQAPDGTIDAPSGPVTIETGQSVSFAGTGTDPDGNVPLTYAWGLGGSGVASSTAEDPGSLTFPFPGTFSVIFTVSDALGLADPTPATVVVTVNSPPVEELPPPAGGSIGQDFFAPAPFDVEVQWVAANLDTPVYLTAPRGDPRLFVLEAGGRIRIIENENVLPVPFLDLSFDTPEAAEEGGLLGLAFDPAYAENGLFYVYRTDRLGDSVLSRFQVSEDPSVADVSSEEELLRVAPPYEAQNGGSIAFGPEDGFLYLGLGDGGSLDDPGNRAQDGGELLGKLLRLDVGVPPARDSIPTGDGYAIPADNPFVDDPHVHDEIWAFGLRNPYRFSFDRELAELWLTDEGQEDREEVNFEARDGAGGRNYGWDVMEGTLCNPDDPAPTPPCGDPSLVLPLHEYPHADGNCAITGGYVYRGTLAELQSEYFFGDFCSGGVWSLDRTSDEATDWTQALGAAVGGVPFQLVSFGEGGAGDLYIVHRNGNIFRFGLPKPECSDGLDNDGDGFIDFPKDPGCRSASSSREDPACDDGLDNDGDGAIDVLDPECTEAWNTDETLGCGLGFELAFVLPPLMWLYRRRRRGSDPAALG